MVLGCSASGLPSNLSPPEPFLAGMGHTARTLLPASNTDPPCHPHQVTMSRGRFLVPARLHQVPLKASNIGHEGRSHFSLRVGH